MDRTLERLRRTLAVVTGPLADLADPEAVAWLVAELMRLEGAREEITENGTNGMDTEYRIRY